MLLQLFTLLIKTPERPAFSNRTGLTRKSRLAHSSMCLFLDFLTGLRSFHLGRMEWSTSNMSRWERLLTSRVVFVMMLYERPQSHHFYFAPVSIIICSCLQTCCLFRNQFLWTNFAFCRSTLKATTSSSSKSAPLLFKNSSSYFLQIFDAGFNLKRLLIYCLLQGLGDWLKTRVVCVTWGAVFLPRAHAIISLSSSRNNSFLFIDAMMQSQV